jgi:hypothetical protein
MKAILSVAAVLEAATGIVLLAYPPIVVGLLFGGGIVGTAEVPGRIAGGALIALGIACLPDGQTRPAFRGMLTYSVLATLILAYVSVRGASVGVLLWPAVAVLLRARYRDGAAREGVGRAGGRVE